MSAKIPARVYGFALCAGLCIRLLAGAEAPADVAAPPADAIRSVSGLAMTVLQAGSGTEHPTGDDCVIVRFTAWKRDGALFSTSGLHGETSTQCLNAAIPGIAEALTAMAPGEKRRIGVPGELAFNGGAKTLHVDRPPKVDLTFELELVRILKAAERPLNLKAPPRNVFRTPSGIAILV